MNDDRQISANSRYYFHILPHFRSKATEPIFTKFFRDVEGASVPLLMVHLYGDKAFRFGKLEQRVTAANVAEERMVKLSTLTVQFLCLKLRGQ